MNDTPAFLARVGLLCTVVFVQLELGAQSAIRFNTSVPGRVNAPMYAEDGRTRLSGSAYVAQLYVGPRPGLLYAIGSPVAFRTGTGAGYLSGGLVPFTIPGLAPGASIYVQLRFWATESGATYETAVTSRGRFGESNIFVLASPDPTLPVPPPGFLTELELQDWSPNGDQGVPTSDLHGLRSSALQAYHLTVGSTAPAHYAGEIPSAPVAGGLVSLCGTSVGPSRVFVLDFSEGLDLVATTSGSSFATVLQAVITPSVSTRGAVAECSDVAGAGSTAGQVSFSLRSDDSCVLAVAGRSGAGGSLQLTVGPSALVDKAQATNNTSLIWRHDGSGDYGLAIVANYRPTAWYPLGTIHDSQWRIAAFTDLDGDTQPELLWHCRTTGDFGSYPVASFAVGAWLPLGQLADTNWSLAGAADFTGDSRSDLVWHNLASGDYGISQLTTGNASRLSHLGQVPDTTWRIVGVGDFTGEGSADLLWHCLSTGDYGIYKMSLLKFDGWFPMGRVTNLNWRIAAAVDVDGDGTTDLVWHNQQTGDYGFALIKAAMPTDWKPISQVADTRWRIVAPR